MTTHRATTKDFPAAHPATEGGSTVRPDAAGGIYNIEAEQSVLGSILLDPDRVLRCVRAAHLDVEAFTQPAHIAVWKAIVALAERQRPIDMLTVSDEMRRQGTLDAAGGSIAIDHLVDATPTAAHAEYYIALVREAAAKRRGAAQAEDFAARFRTGDSPGDVLREMRQFLNSEEDRLAEERTGASLADIYEREIDASATLLGTRFFCRYGVLLFVGPAGRGKSSGGVQQDALWALGLPAFDIRPARPLTSLTVQAENDDGDLIEMAQGVIRGLGLEHRIDELRERTHYVMHRESASLDFLGYLDGLLRRYRPDYVRLDPLQNYLGCDPSDVEKVSAFACGLDAILLRHGCAAILNHHTPKTNNRDTSKWSDSDWMYAGAGSQRLSAWARAIMVMEEVGDGVFRFRVPKRGYRVGWIDDQGQPTTERYFRHCREHGVILWEHVAPEDVPAPTRGGRKVITEADILDLIPPAGSIEKNALIQAGSVIGSGEKRTRRLIELLAERGTVRITHEKREAKRDRILVEVTERKAVLPYAD